MNNTKRAEITKEWDGVGMEVESNNPQPKKKTMEEIYCIDLNLISQVHLCNDTLSFLKKKNVTTTKDFFEKFEQLILSKKFNKRIKLLNSYLKKFMIYPTIKNAILKTKERINRVCKNNLIPQVRIILTSLRLFKNVITQDAIKIKKYLEEKNVRYPRKYMQIIFS